MDAHSVAVWVDVGENLPRPVACVTHGWLIEDTAEHVTLAGTLSLNRAGKVHGYGEVISIPKKGFVKKMKGVKL